MRYKVIILALGVASMIAATMDAHAQSVETPRRAGDFVQSIGVNVHITGSTPGYGNGKLENVIAMLNMLGIHHVRDNLHDVDATHYAVGRYQTLGEAGNRLDVMLTSKVIGDPAAEIAALRPDAAYIEAFEGPNEVDFTPVTYGNQSGTAGVIAYQKALYDAVHSDTAFNNTPVLAFTVAHTNLVPSYGNASSGADFGNVHLYGTAAYKGPSYNLIAPGMTANTTAPQRPTVVTETSYRGKPNPTTTDELMVAKYILDELFETANLGSRRTYIYQLVDGGDDHSDPENNFGLFRDDFTPKASALAVRNLISFLNDTGQAAQSFTPTPLAYTITQTDHQRVAFAGTDAQAFHTLLQSSDGTYYIAVWADARSDAAPITNKVTLAFPKPHASISVYDPIDGKTVSTLSDSATVTLTTSDHPLIVKLSVM